MENNDRDSDVEDNSENDVFSDDERPADSDDEAMEEDEMSKSKKYGITYGKKVQ